jgi:micrococcal nuclease
LSKVDFFLVQVRSQLFIQVRSLLYKYRASHWGAFFVGSLFITTTLSSSQVFAVECPTERIDETAAVSQIVDGDTLRLKDGRLVRFIGINTPELARKGKPAEPLARKARQMLESLLEEFSQDGDTMVGMRFGVERKDRYGRTLAHVYLANGASVEAQMLSTGMAAQIVVPPNIWNRDCYHAAEQDARQAIKGVWNSFYRPIPVADIPRQSRGFRIIGGKVVRVGESKRSIWLNFARRPGEGHREGVAVRISRKDLSYFNSWDPRNLKGKQVVVRGWVYPYKKQLVMQLRHPLALEIKSDERE